jgi:hypothetical protein
VHFLGAAVFSAASVLGILVLMMPKRPAIGFVLLSALPALVVISELMLWQWHLPEPGAGFLPAIGGVVSGAFLGAAAYGRWQRK